ncbi:MAG: Crp/Fnr family transcriptional regulator [Tenuifilaceae bacterium]|jgi:CRP-like cAMP-binding protein|nr:Crp/Fnr family transcriptional regulator [Tenuifilaceae bacterium]
MAHPTIDIQSAFEGVCSLFYNLKAREKEQLFRGFSCSFYRKGEIIYRDGDAPKGLVCLIKGKVKVFKEGVGGRDQIVRMAKPIGFIGYRALLADDNHIASAEALEDCVIATIDKSCFIKILQSNALLTYHILKSVATELGLSNSRTVTLTQKHIRGRLAESLVFLRDTYGLEDDNQTIKVYLSREDLANLSNMTTSNAIRTLSAFSDEKILELDGRRIKIIDPYKLERISDLG